MKKIAFRRFQKDSRKISCNCNLNSSEEENECWGGDIEFEFNIDNKPSDDAIALALSCLVGSSNFDQVLIDLEVCKDIAKRIEEFCNCEVIFKSKKERNYESNFDQNIILNFSGGLDSLAALSIVEPKRLKLVAIEFGGWFKRESDFFPKFSPYIVKTNFRQTPFFKKLEAKNWQFMGIGSILFCELLKASYFIFGTILEADPNLNVSAGSRTRPFDILGLKNLHIVRGLTEVGTTKIACYYQNREIITESLVSLSSPGSSKRLRKDLLASLFLPNIQINPVNKFHFGKDYTFDFLLLYILKKKGLDYVSPYVKGIPDDLINLVNNLSLKFYDRLNPRCLVEIPDSDFLSFYIQNLLNSGICFYEKKDFEELAEVRRILSRHYKQENRHYALHFVRKEKNSNLPDDKYSKTSQNNKHSNLYEKIRNKLLSFVGGKREK